jgi:hypothetical protein
MKPCHSIVVFLFLICCIAVSSVHGYNCAKQNIIRDMNQALAQTLSEKQDGWITPDTIQNYRSHLKITELRDRSFLYYAMNNNAKAELCSRKMRWHQDSSSLEFQSYADCSLISVLALSNQRLTGVLSLMALLWMIFSLGYFRNYHKGMIVFGDMMLDEVEQCFYDLKHRPVHLTPMQQQLMMMFFTVNDHKLSKQDICDALWPKKPDASDTLYTLIKRLKLAVEKNGNLEIVSDRGKDYQLQIKN